MIKPLMLALSCVIACATAQAQDTVACKASAYVVDPDPQGLNVRAGPGSASKALARIHNGDLVRITGARGQWIRIDRAESEADSEDYQTVFSGEGWIFGPLLGVGPSWNEDGKTPVHEQPSAGSRVLQRLAYEANPGGVLQGCRGDWLDLQYEGKPRPLRGWVEAGKVCVNLRTECS
ncbi:MAG TPA: SH3 domain-containing protein [Solimonas sp.]|nr:SH3 domain-containing protein [Solimonas sp.]